jgi:hypothetical protein
LERLRRVERRVEHLNLRRLEPPDVEEFIWFCSVLGNALVDSSNAIFSILCDTLGDAFGVFSEDDIINSGLSVFSSRHELCIYVVYMQFFYRYRVFNNWIFYIHGC